MFGKVNEGVHSIRLFNIAIVDVIGTIIMAYLIKKMCDLKTPVLNIVIMLIILSIPIHMYFCVDTTLTRMFKM
jgi:hypothetical protein